MREHSWRERLFIWLVINVFKYSLEHTMPRYLTILRFIMMPSNTFYWLCLEPHNRIYDLSLDEYKICGQRYSGAYFKELSVGGMPAGQLFRVDKRDDGVIWIKRLGIGKAVK